MPFYRTSPVQRVAALRAWCDERPEREKTFQLILPKLQEESRIHIKFADGVEPYAYCGHCGDSAADVLCDHVLGEGRTCDRQICLDCASTIGTDLHLCPTHAAMARDEVRLNESAMQRLAVSAARVAELERQLAHSEAGRKNAEREAQVQHDRANEANARARTLVGARGMIDDGKG